MSNAHLGKKHSSATKQRISEAARKPHAYAHRRPMSAATKAKISATLKGRHHSEETKQKLRERLLERSALVKAGVLPRFKHSEETKQRLKELAVGRKPSAQCLLASAAARKEKAFKKRVEHQLKIGFYN